MNPPPADGPSSPPSAKRVLIVDKQGIIRTILVAVLESWGSTAHIARDLVGACRMVVSDGPFDAIICNYDLPDGNAYDLVDWMREQQLDVPTIVPYGALQPMREPPERVKLLAKPFDPIELREALEHADQIGVHKKRVADGV